MADRVLAQHLHDALQRYRPRRRWWRRWVKRSAVAIIVREDRDEPEVLMIRRAEREGDRWSGQMGFPGGRMETDDQHGRATAERETLEEIGVDLDDAGHCIGRLSDIISHPHQGRRPMVVTPYVYIAHTMPPVRRNHEVAGVLWVPLRFFTDLQNRETMKWKYRGLSRTLPCYFYRDCQIWGLSLAMLDELLGLVDEGVARQPRWI